MIGRVAWVPLAFAAASVGCMHPRTKPRSVAIAHESAPVVAPAPSCTEAPTSNAAAFPATIMLTPTPGWNEIPAPASTSPSDAAPAGTPIPAATGAPALRYAALDSAACLAELKKRNISFTSATATTGVDTPVRLNGKLHGVDVHGLEPPAKRATSIWEIVDCRLVLAIDDLTAILAKHDVVEVVHMSMYRPPPKNSKAKPARHDAALALDLGTMIKKDGTKLRVLEDWHGGIGTKTCGNGAGPSPATKEAVELRTILCAAADAQLFNVVLTPNYNKPHANHFHLEVTRGVKWFIVH
jgi:hypothetical protein